MSDESNQTPEPTPGAPNPTYEWERACDQILAAQEADKPILHAQLLISHFLVPMAEHRTAEVNHNWIGVAGHISRPIRIANGNGEIIGELPPLISPIDTQIVENESQNLGHITEEAQKHAMISPRAGDLFMQEGFAKRGFRSTSLLKAMLTWNELAEKVGGPIPFEELHKILKQTKPEPVAETPNSALGISDEDELV